MNSKSFMNKNDPYRWLEVDSRKRKSWISDQEKQTLNYLSQNTERETLKQRLWKLFRVDEMRIPIPRGELYFFRYRKANDEQHSVYVRKGMLGKKTFLFNPNSFPQNIRIMNDWVVSKDARFIALELSRSGNDKNVIKVFDVIKRKFIADTIPEKGYPYFSSWNDDSSGFWYIRGEFPDKKGEEKYYKKIYFHKIGSNAASDSMYYGKNLKKEDWPALLLSGDGHHILIHVVRKDRKTAIFYRNADKSDGHFVKITQGMRAESSAGVSGGYIYLLTDHHAPNNKILRRKIMANGKLEKWKLYVRDRKYKLESWAIPRGYLFLEYLVDTSSELYSINLSKNTRRKIPLPFLGSVGTFSYEFNGSELFYTFSSFISPVSIYRINLVSSSIKLWWRGMLKPLENTVIKQNWYRSKDGTRVPMFIVHNKNVRLNSNNPVILYAYGGFGISMTPAFWRQMVPFIEDGGIFALANIRGGGEFGERWHKASILRKKQNGFDDFHHAIKHLIQKKYSNPNRIAIMGGSNGGLLMCATILQHPELVRAALIIVPVTDMLRFHLFNGGRFWISEYGDPEDPKMRRFLLSYSPYHNVKHENYPSSMFITSEHDDRVNPLHAYKMIAALKKNPAQKNPILLRLEKEAGHSGANLITPIVDEQADELAFVYKELEIGK